METRRALPGEILPLKELITRLFEGSYRSMQRSVDGLTEEQLYWQPATHANSIGWLVWNMMRRRDYYSAVFYDEPHVWVTGGWHQSIGRDPDATGMGDTPEEVARFRPSFELVLEYAEACQAVGLERVNRLTKERLDARHFLDGGRGAQSGWSILWPLTNDGSNRAGQIEYLRGLISGFGWQTE